MYLQKQRGACVACRAWSTLFDSPFFLPIILLVVAVFSFLLPLQAGAQETSATSDTGATVAGVIEDVALAAEETTDVEELQSIAQAEEDSSVTEEDLGVSTRFYSFKKLFRPLRRAVTFNKEKDIELEVRYASEDLAHAQHLFDEDLSDGDNIDKAIKAVDNYEKALQKIEAHAAKSENLENGGVLEHIIDKQIKQQKILEHIERRITDHAPQEVVSRVIDRIDRSRNESAMHMGHAVSSIEGDPERLAEHFDNALTRQRGSEFKDIRNLEVLKRLEDHVAGQAKEAIIRAQEHTITRFVQGMDQSPNDGQADRFEHYVKHVGGDDTRHLEVYDNLKNEENLPSDFFEKLEVAKDIAAQKFKKRSEDFDEKFGDEVMRERMRERMFARFKDAPLKNFADGPSDGYAPPEVGEFRKLRALEEIRQRVEFDNVDMTKRFEQEHEDSIKEFKNAFPDEASQKQAERFRELSRNPDSTTFRLLQQLEDEVRSDPKKRAFLEKIDRDAKMEFAQQAQKHGQEFYDKIISNNPQDIDVFKQLQKEFEQNPEHFIVPGGPGEFGPSFGENEGFSPGRGPEGFGPPPEFRLRFDQLLDTQSEGLAKHVMQIDDAEMLKFFQDKFEHGSDDTIHELHRRQGDFGAAYNERVRSVGQQSGWNKEIEAERYTLDQEREVYKKGLEKRVSEAKARGDFDEVRLLEAEREAKEKGFGAQTISIERRGFDSNLKKNPFCDANCQKEEGAYFEKMIREREDAMRYLYRNADSFPPPSNMLVDPKQVCMWECANGQQCTPGQVSARCDECAKKCGLQNGGPGPDAPKCMNKDRLNKEKQDCESKGVGHVFAPIIKHDAGRECVIEARCKFFSPNENGSPGVPPEPSENQRPPEPSFQLPQPGTRPPVVQEQRPGDPRQFDSQYRPDIRSEDAREREIFGGDVKNMSEEQRREMMKKYQLEQYGGVDNQRPEERRDGPDDHQRYDQPPQPSTYQQPSGVTTESR